MAWIIVRNIDKRVVASLKRRAALQGRSLERQAREILSASAGLTPEERFALAERISAMTPSHVRQTNSTELIREDRDSR